jgi:hypothetical protein
MYVGLIPEKSSPQHEKAGTSRVSKELQVLPVLQVVQERQVATEEAGVSGAPCTSVSIPEKPGATTGNSFAQHDHKIPDKPGAANGHSCRHPENVGASGTTGAIMYVCAGTL